MKNKIIWILFGTGLLLGTIFANTQINIQLHEKHIMMEMNIKNYVVLICKRILEVVAAAAIIKLLPKKMSDAGIAGLAGGMVGLLVSIYAVNGSLLYSFAYYGIVLVVIFLYACLIKIICQGERVDRSSVSDKAVKIKKPFWNLLAVVTILLINITLEVKILKFF